MRPFHLASSLLLLGFQVACSSTDPSGTVTLATDAKTYVMVPGAPNTPLQLTLQNATPVDIQFQLCLSDVFPFSAVLRWEQQQLDGSWAPGPFPPVVCEPTEHEPFVLQSLSSTLVPPVPLDAADAPGTYRIKMEWQYLYDSTPRTVTSNSYVVTQGAAP